MRHDAHYKRLFGHPGMTGDLLALLRDGLGGRFPILMRVQPDTLERLPAEFIADNLSPRFADLVWKVRLSGPDGTNTGRNQADRQSPSDRWLYLVVLLEFQSRVDWMMAARVQDYAAQLWLDLHRRESFGRDRAPPPILPVVVYNGDRPWNAPTRVLDLWSPDQASGQGPIYGGIEAGRLKFCGDGFVLLDLQALEGSELPNENGVAWLARVESVSDDQALFAALEGVFEWLDQAADGTLGTAVLGWMRALTESRRLVEAEEFEMAVQAAESKKRLKGHWTERVYQDRMRRMAQAREEGEALGLKRERTLLSRQAGRRFGADAARRLAPVLERADHDSLMEIGDWIVDAENADELMKRCQDADPAR